MNKKEVKEARQGADLQEDINESSGDSSSFSQDIQLGQMKNYPSEAMPQDMYQYKKMRINPDAVADFPGLVDKDFVMANMTGDKPNLQQKRFEVGTFNLVKSVFVTEKIVEFVDATGNTILDEKGEALCIRKNMFDSDFEPILEFLRGDIKSELVGSRALDGYTREAVLDITTSLRKEVDKRREEKKSNFGL